MTDITPSPYAKGYWIWDEDVDCLNFVSTVPKQVVQIAGSEKTQDNRHAASITFRDSFDMVTQMYFKINFQRRVKLTDPCVITLQDVKDVAIFTANPNDLSPNFINFLHTETMDGFLRSLIIYFQYYLQVWERLIFRREETKRKLYQPKVTIIENVIRDNLADLRSMVAKYYSYILLGVNDVAKWHHMSKGTNVSLSDKDRQQFEALICMLTRIVWIALYRKYLILIEMELNRLFRTNLFNMKLRETNLFKTNEVEDRVLLGKAYRLEKKLKHKSPVIQEFIYDVHDYKMFAIGQTRSEPYDTRLEYLETAYTSPEEFLVQKNIYIGILGQQRNNFEPLLKSRESLKKDYPPFEPPPKDIGENVEHIVSDILPRIPPTYNETEQTKEARQTQCTVWKSYLLHRLIETEL